MAQPRTTLSCWPGLGDRCHGTLLSRFRTPVSRTHVCNKSHSRVVQTQASVMSLNDTDNQCDTYVLEVVCLRVGVAFELRDQALSPLSNNFFLMACPINRVCPVLVVLFIFLL